MLLKFQDAGSVHVLLNYPRFCEGGSKVVAVVQAIACNRRLSVRRRSHRLQSSPTPPHAGPVAHLAKLALYSTL